MKQVFADAFYWIASINPNDDWHRQVRAVTKTLNQVQIVTTDEILTEALNFFSSRGTQLRQKNAQLVRQIMDDPNVLVLQQTHESFLAGLALYETRPDKGYSLTDCISMNTMRQLSITEVLTHDHHFAQEGFTVLLGSAPL